MIENVNVQYVGFEAKSLVREYCFIVPASLKRDQRIYPGN
jgi:hypothetical protein